MRERLYVDVGESSTRPKTSSVKVAGYQDRNKNSLLKRRSRREVRNWGYELHNVWVRVNINRKERAAEEQSLSG
jgi:hypothetical protein